MSRRSSIIQSLGVALAALVLGSALAGCAGRPAGVSEEVSESCSTNKMIYEWDGTKGADTPAGALEQIVGEYRDALNALPSDAPRDSVDSLKDRVRLMVTVRGVEALIPLANDVVASKVTGYVLVEAKTADGTPLARANIFQPEGGGYRVADFNAVGFMSDDPTCR